MGQFIRELPPSRPQFIELLILKFPKAGFDLLDFVGNGQWQWFRHSFLSEGAMC